MSPTLISARRRQAAALAPLIAALHPDARPFAASARRTAEARPPFTSRFRSSRFCTSAVGDMSGTPIRGDFGVWPDTLARWVAGETWYAPAGAESFDQVRNRVLPVWDRVTLENQGKTLVIVAHGIVVRVILLSIVEGYNAADWPRLGRIANASLTEVVGSGRSWQALRISHVPDEVRNAHGPEEVRPLGDDRARPPAPGLWRLPRRTRPISPPVPRAVRMKTPLRAGRYHLPLPLLRTNPRAAETT